MTLTYVTKLDYTGTIYILVVEAALFEQGHLCCRKSTCD